MRPAFHCRAEEPSMATMLFLYKFFSMITFCTNRRQGCQLFGGNAPHKTGTEDLTACHGQTARVSLCYPLHHGLWKTSRASGKVPGNCKLILPPAEITTLCSEIDMKILNFKQIIKKLICCVDSKCKYLRPLGKPENYPVIALRKQSSCWSMSLFTQMVSEIIYRAVSVMKAVNQADSQGSGKDMTLKVNIIMSHLWETPGKTR